MANKKTKKLPKVTAENYYDPKIQMAYMGASQFKAFQKCEAAAMAELTGEWTTAKTQALLVGGYVDAYFSGEMDQFREQNPEIFSSRPPWGLKSEYKMANKIISRMERDKLYMLLMAGKKQVIKTGFIAGVPFKIKIDVLLNADECRQVVKEFPSAAEALGMCDGAIVDQKLMSNFESVWSSEEQDRITFIEYWGYDTQGAIYQEIEGNMLPFIINAGTKEDEPDLGAFYIRDEDLQEKLHEVEDKAPRYQAIKDGKIAPVRCEKCKYCRATKLMQTIADYKELIWR